MSAHSVCFSGTLSAALPDGLSPDVSPGAPPDSGPSSGPPIGPDAPWLAPLAGYSDLPFRLLCKENGAAATCTEMVSAKGLIYGLRKKKRDSGTEDLLVTAPEDTPLIVQLFGEDPDFISAAARELAGRGYSYFDLNMGCSVPKVTKTGAGAALLKNPNSALAAGRALFQAVGAGRAGCKLRLGWDATSEVYLDLAKALEDAGAAWITLHPRYARQGFGGDARLEALEKLSKSVRIPVIASGDLFSASDGVQRLDLGVAGVMFARGAMANPAIFMQYRSLLCGETVQNALPPGQLLALIRRHAALARELTPGKPGRSGFSPALLKMRGAVPRYVRHLPGARHLRAALVRCASWDELDDILRDFFNTAEIAEASAFADKEKE